MDLSISDELQLFSKELQQHMSPYTLNQLASKVGFVQRKSIYRVQDLVVLNTDLLFISLHNLYYRYL
ncbi:hypothetical protein CN694_29345 [Bacillus wiedmannii]|uniref:Uncharacterized protein n=1 Tax=Bacillus wiedmannii TaxID=1890302 RepID=A0AB73R2D5_9BACI|nr:hypothetical protein CN694_29345 [Bacillus wiedmannii]